MSRKRNFHPRQPPLGMRSPKHPRPSQRTQTRLTMIWHKELLRRRFLEPLQATPSHILNHQQRPVSDQNHIQCPMRNDRPIQPLDH